MNAFSERSELIVMLQITSNASHQTTFLRPSRQSVLSLPNRASKSYHRLISSFILDLCITGMSKRTAPTTLTAHACSYVFHSACNCLHFQMPYSTMLQMSGNAHAATAHILQCFYTCLSPKDYLFQKCLSMSVSSFLYAAQALFSKLTIHDLHRLVVQLRPSLFISGFGFHRFAHASVVDVNCQH